MLVYLKSIIMFCIATLPCARGQARGRLVSHVGTGGRGVEAFFSFATFGDVLEEFLRKLSSFVRWVRP